MLKKTIEPGRLDDRIILEKIESKYSELKPKKTKANCIGTALFLAGLIKNDCEIDSYSETRKYLKRLEQSPFSIKATKIGHLITYEFYQDGQFNVLHMAIVVNMRPLLFTERTFSGGPVYLYSTLDDMNNSRGHFDRRMLYDPFSPLQFP